MSQNQADTEPEAGRVAGRAEGRSVSSSRRQIPECPHWPSCQHLCLKYQILSESQNPYVE